MKKILFIGLCIVLIGCKNPSSTSEKLNVVTTTTMITDLVKNIGGDAIEINGLMGAGVDPHLFKASEGDVSKLYHADVIFYNGLHLEGKLVEVFEKMESQQKKTIALGEQLDKDGLIGSDYFASNYDPHVWFNIQYFKEFANTVTQVLSEEDPKNSELFVANNNLFQKKLTDLETEVKAIIETLPQEKRILVTAHDAFNYFGKEYGFNVVGLQGLSTATEAGVQDVQKLSDFIIENKVKAIFIESSVPRRTIEALQQAVLSKNHEVIIGGSLFSDALGDANTVEGTYIGMFLYNVTTIVNALK
ncbi:zinc ABC transporter substrate-binding protein [Aureisphaera sp. CAU 1614]|uniref:Zinc ABC transporter substrate-binding protein n=1 Tax=Halomarinibacterium sedimenti TaxID=2857106 RepID=A0A9X1FMP8_9FLAO|nr:zinc ABC transporter substrate-binding protein [Halomarinibacterium sedimenti]MBW2937155.1 zinc ABC transporter substrate-binding protein [Halomarinibacterium sedimenti]